MRDRVDGGAPGANNAEHVTTKSACETSSQQRLSVVLQKRIDTGQWPVKTAHFSKRNL